MAIASLTNVEKHFGRKVLFEKLDLNIYEGERIGYLVQNPKFDPENTVMDEAELGFAELHDLAHEMRELEHKMAETEGDALEKILEKYQNVQHEFDLAGGYVWQH